MPDIQIKALIFDVDGTLSETEEVHRRAFNDTFDAFGLGWNWGRDLYRAAENHRRQGAHGGVHA